MRDPFGYYLDYLYQVGYCLDYLYQFVSPPPRVSFAVIVELNGLIDKGFHYQILENILFRKYCSCVKSIPIFSFKEYILTELFEKTDVCPQNNVLRRKNI